LRFFCCVDPRSIFLSFLSDSFPNRELLARSRHLILLLESLGPPRSRSMGYSLVLEERSALGQRRAVQRRRGGDGEFAEAAV